MRLHKNLVFAVIESLDVIFNKNIYADKAVKKVLKRNKRWGSRDRKFVAETIYDIVRWKRLYAEIAEVRQPFNRSNMWRLFAVWCVLRGIQLPDWKQIEPTPTRRIKGRFDKLSKIRKFRESIPDWIDHICSKELGEEIWNKEIAALNRQTEVILRTNTLNISKKQLQHVLVKENIYTESIQGYESALKLVKRANVFKTNSFNQGLFEVQDASSQLVAEYLNVAPGMKVIDTCAGTGGKTLHIASLMKNKGQIIAMDIYESKLKKLKIRARRNNVHNIDTRLIDSNKLIKKLHRKADRVLIDAPCSGLGVLRRNPDSKWKLQPQFLDEIKTVQQNILQQYSRMVKPSGQLVYATCSILPSENQQQIEKFLTSQEGKEFTFIKDQKLLAHQSGFDGFYMALLQRN